jgi:hypothetical protein
MVTKFFNILTVTRITLLSLTIVGFLFSLIFPGYSGILIAASGIYGLIFGAKLLTVVLSAFALPLGQAFQYFIGEISNLRFISPGDDALYYLSLGTVFFYIFIFIMDFKYGDYKPGRVLINIRLPRLPGVFFFPTLLFFVVTIIILTNFVSPMWSNDYNVFVQNRYGFLEYFGLLTMLVYCSNRSDSDIRLYAIRIIWCVVFISLVLWGFRMAAVLFLLSVVVLEMNQRSINRLGLIFVVVVAYVLLTAIGSLRFGYMPEFGNLIGLGNVALDNTFTGVIETSLMYIEISESIELTSLLYYFFSMVSPVPYSMLPYEAHYIGTVYEEFSKVPGGGLIASFFYYFGVPLLFLIMAVLFTVYKYESIKTIAGSVMLIAIFSSPRWFLYGPYVLFKLSGLWLIFLVVITLIFTRYRKTAKNL